MPEASFRPAEARLYFLDNLRTALTVLVIFSHTCIAYGGEGSWGYQSRFHPRSLLLTAVNALAQTFFMGGFFFLSGHLSRVSLSRKLPYLFLKEKLIRVGVPTLTYTLLGYPLRESALHLILHRRWPIANIVRVHWANLRGIQGPVWYGALLLIFDSCYTLIQKQVMTRAAPQAIGIDSAEAIPFTVIGCGLLSFVVRLKFPSTYVFTPLNLRVGYVPQYIFAYACGTRIVHPDVTDLLPTHSARTLGTLTIGCLAINGAILNSTTTWTIESYSGGWNPIALCYAIWNDSLGYLIFAASYNLFRRSLNQTWRISRYSYAAFLVHSPVSIAVEAAVDDWRANALVKAAVVGTLNVGASFAAAWCLLQAPGVRRIL